MAEYSQLMFNSGRREFLIGTSTAVLSSGLLTGSETVAASPTKTHSSNGFVDMGDVVETDTGELVHVRPGETAPRTEQSSVTTASNGELTVTAVTVPIGPSFTAGGTAEIWVGAYHDTEGVPEPAENEPLTVAITRPDGEEDSFDVETGSEGNNRLEYDLSVSGRGEGQYDVAVTHDEVSQSATTDFAVGTALDITTSTWEPAPIGRDVTVSALARNGEDPVSGVDVALSVTDPDGTVIAETVETTDDDGFVTVSATPEQTGRHSISAEIDDSTESTYPRQTSSTLRVVDVGVASSLLLRHAIPGRTNVYGGYLTDSNGMVANATLTLEFVERFGDEELILEEQVTTDENGFFLLEFDLPADVTRDLEIEAELDDGRELMLSVDRLRVNEFDEDDSEEVSLDASFSDWVNSPGADAEIEIEAEDGGDPIANTDVDIALRYERNGPIMFSTTVTTSDDGTTTATVPIPETAPDSARVNGEASIEYDDTVHTDSLSTNLEEYDFNFDAEANLGGTSAFSIEVADRQTEGPIEGFPLLYDAQYAYSAAGSFDQGSLVSGSDGTDESTVSIPEDVQFLEYANYRNRYQERVYRWLEPDYPGELSISQDSVAAGETVDIEFSTPDTSAAQGIVFGDVGSPRKSLGASIATDEPALLTIPNHVAGESLILQLWATDGNGQLYSGRVSVEIDADTEPPDDPDDELVEAPGGVEIPSKYADDDGTVGPSGLLDAGTDFETGEADINTLLDVGTAFQNS